VSVRNRYFRLDPINSHYPYRVVVKSNTELHRTSSSNPRLRSKAVRTLLMD